LLYIEARPIAPKNMARRKAKKTEKSRRMPFGRLLLLLIALGILALGIVVGVFSQESLGAFWAWLIGAGIGVFGLVMGTISVCGSRKQVEDSLCQVGDAACTRAVEGVLDALSP
jgi:hypothetical protein